MRLTEQTKNVIVILDNAAKSKCINSDLSIDMSMKNTVDMAVVKMNINFFQKNDQYHQVLKETLDQFIATNTEDRCVRKLDIFKHKGEFLHILKQMLTEFDQSTRPLAPFKRR